jgi:serine/threonine-protein kinase
MIVTTLLIIPVLLVQVAPQAELAAHAKEVLRSHCLECHGGVSSQGGLKILDRDNLVVKIKVVVPKNTAESELFRRISEQHDAAMPPPGRRPLNAAEIVTLREWIEAGAPAFPSDVPTRGIEPNAANIDSDPTGAAAILADVRKLEPEARKSTRYFTLAHLASGGATPQLVQSHRLALEKVINHLSRQPHIVRLRAIDPLETIFALDIRQVGWQLEPLQADGERELTTHLDLFDLALLEYPYGLHGDTAIFRDLEREYFVPANLCRPIAAVRGDWFVCNATQSPLYDDFLQLPRTLLELEKFLGVDAAANVKSGQARRAGFAVSGVSRNGRVVERHRTTDGAYWKSFDFSTNQGPENFFADPVNLHPFGGEMIFSLPNGLQGYMIVDRNGQRLNLAPTSVVVDAFADDATVRNGLSCIRCHQQGIKRFVDDIRPVAAEMRAATGISKEQVLQLYASQDEMDKLCESDIQRFQRAEQAMNGSLPTQEPVAIVAERFLEFPLGITAASGELGVADQQELRSVFRTRTFVGLGLIPLASGKVVRRDHWESIYGRVAQELGVGLPIPPLDGLTHGSVISEASQNVTVRTNHPNNLFLVGDELKITVQNGSNRRLFVELLGIDVSGKIALLTQQPQEVAAGQELTHPSQGALRIRPQLGVETIVAYASSEAFSAGVVLRGNSSQDRIVHCVSGGSTTLQAANDLRRLSKFSLTIETR